MANRASTEDFLTQYGDNAKFYFNDFDLENERPDFVGYRNYKLKPGQSSYSKEDRQRAEERINDAKKSLTRDSGRAVDNKTSRMINEQKGALGNGLKALRTPDQGKYFNSARYSDNTYGRLSESIAKADYNPYGLRTANELAIPDFEKGTDPMRLDQFNAQFKGATDGRIGSLNTYSGSYYALNKNLRNNLLLGNAPTTVRAEDSEELLAPSPVVEGLLNSIDSLEETISGHLEGNEMNDELLDPDEYKAQEAGKPQKKVALSTGEMQNLLADATTAKENILNATSVSDPAKAVMLKELGETLTMLDELMTIKMEDLETKRIAEHKKHQASKKHKDDVEKGNAEKAVIEKQTSLLQVQNTLKNEMTSVEASEVELSTFGNRVKTEEDLGLKATRAETPASRTTLNVDKFNGLRVDFIKQFEPPEVQIDSGS